jgi:hypothetical protein
MLTPFYLSASFGFALTQFGVKLTAELAKHQDAGYEGVRRHFHKSLRVFEEQR